MCQKVIVMLHYDGLTTLCMSDIVSDVYVSSMESHVSIKVYGNLMVVPVHIS